MEAGAKRLRKTGIATSLLLLIVAVAPTRASADSLADLATSTNGPRTCGVVVDGDSAALVLGQGQFRLSKIGSTDFVEQASVRLDIAGGDIGFATNAARDRVYVADGRGRSPGETGTIRVVSVASLSELASISVPVAARHIAISRNGELVAASGGGTSGDGIAIVKLSDSSVRTVPVPTSVGPITFSDDGAFLYANIGGTSVDGKGTVGARIVRVNVESLAISDVIKFEASNPFTQGLAIDSRFAYTFIGSSSTKPRELLKVSLSTGEIVARVELPYPEYSFAYARFVVSPDGLFLYVTAEKQLVKVNLEAFRVVGKTDIPDQIYCSSVSASGDFALVTTFNSIRNVRRVNLSKTELPTIEFKAPQSLMLRADPFMLAATSTSGLPVTLTSRSPDTCIVQDGALRALKAGSCLLRASQERSPGWEPVAQEIQILITRTQMATGSTIEIRSLAENAGFKKTSNSKVSLSVSRQSKKVCRVVGRKLQGLQAGKCQISVAVRTAAGVTVKKTLGIRVNQ